MSSVESNPPDSPRGDTSFFMRLLSVVLVLFRVLAVGVLIVGGIVVKALARRNPLPALLVLVAILALAALLWGVKSFILLIVRDGAREQPSRKVAWLKLVLGVILLGFFLAGVEIDGGFVPWGSDTFIGVLRTGHTGYLQPLLYGLPVAFGLVWLLSGALGLLGKRPGWGACLGLTAVVMTACGLGAPALSSVRQVPFPAEDSYNEVVALAFSPDGTRLAVAGKGKSRGVTIWDVAGRQQVLSLEHKGSKARKVFFSADGKRIAVQFEGSYPAGFFRIWDANTGAEINGYEIQGHAAAFSPDGKLTASVSSLDVILQEADTGKVSVKIHHPGGIQTLAFSPDSRYLVVGGNLKGEQATTIVWGVADGEKVRTLPMPKGEISDAVFSRDGRRLATTSSIRDPRREETITIWDMETGEVLSSFGGDDKYFFSLAFHPAGRYLAVTEMGATRIWDTATKEVIVRLPGEHLIPGSVAYSPDGDSLAWGGKRVVLWDVSKIGK